MAPLTDPVRRRAYQNALANWSFTDFVRWKKVAAQWVYRELPGWKLKAIAEQMHLHVAAGGVIDEQPETREEWLEYEFHYDLRIRIDNRRIYIETLLSYDNPDDPDDPTIRVVSIHDQ